jgi:hypothetical protein
MASWLLLLPGSIILANIFGTDNVSPAVPVFILLAFWFMLLAFLTGFACDSLRLAAASGTGRGMRNGTDRNECIGEAENTAII